MKHNLSHLAIITLVVISGSAIHAQPQPSLSDGEYRMESDIKKPGVERNYGGISQCKVTVQGTSIKIESVNEPAGGWYEGSITGSHLIFSVRMSNPDPMYEAMQVRQTYEGDVRATDYAEGVMNSYTGTNPFLSGTWTLKKIE